MVRASRSTPSPLCRLSYGLTVAQSCNVGQLSVMHVNLCCFLARVYTVTSTGKYSSSEWFAEMQLHVTREEQQLRAAAAPDFFFLLRASRKSCLSTQLYFRSKKKKRQISPKCLLTAPRVRVSRDLRVSSVLFPRSADSQTCCCTNR